MFQCFLQFVTKYVFQRPPNHRHQGDGDGEHNHHKHAVHPHHTGDAHDSAMTTEMKPEERIIHEGFMREAIKMAELALVSDETPVGCVFVRNGVIIGKGMNETNRTLNGTRHAEFVALAGILSKEPISIIKETDLYVTVEPCVMCASMLRQYGIRKVFFGCWNDRFGGTGGVLNIHSDPSVDKPYPVFGGIFREEAIMLLRKFYVQENEKAPEPKQKRTRELKTEILPMDIHEPKDKDKGKAPVPRVKLPPKPEKQT